MKMNSIGKMTLISRGMPTGKQEYRASLPAPPTAWAARLASTVARYSGVSGACCPRPMGLVGSHCMPPVRSHWPDQSGYLVSSCARAAAIVVTITVASTTAPIELRTGMLSSHSAMGEETEDESTARLEQIPVEFTHNRRA